jgi:molybdenum cofactor synthesis domain-containing protein
MVRRFSYVTVEEAFKTIANVWSRYAVNSELIPIDGAYGRVLAENIVSKVNIPSHDMSHFDGYAIKAVDTKEASVTNPVLLRVIDKVYPGQIPDCEVHHGEAVYITTGSFLPKGADSIVAVEATKMDNRDQIEMRSHVKPSDHVIGCGSDIAKEQILLREGHKIRAQDLTLLATLRIREIRVVRKPVLAVICVGDELTDTIDEITEGKIVNSHRYTVSAMIQEAGGEAMYLGIATDQVTEIREKIEAGIVKADMVLLIGGSSMGNKDATSDAVDSVGKPGLIIHGLKRKPGRVSGFAVVRDKPIVLLPGLCHSLVVGFYTFVLPLLRAMSGLALSDTQLTVGAKLSQQISFKRFLPFEQVTFVKVKRTQEGYKADPYIGDSSSFGTLVCSNAFIITPPGKRMVRAGETVNVHLLPSFFSLNDLLTTKA